MQLFHGSREVVSEIRDDGVFGGIFAGVESSARAHGSVLHIVTSPRPLTDFELNYSVDGAWEAALDIADGDETIAICIMDAECPELESCPAAECGAQGWEFQRLRGELARRLGYTSVEMSDEHGTTWLCLQGCEIKLAADQP